jgi:hypothetical protein
VHTPKSLKGEGCLRLKSFTHRTHHKLSLLGQFFYQSSSPLIFLQTTIMRLTSFSLWLGCLASSTLAFSSLSKPQRFGRVVSRGGAQGLQQQNVKTSLGVASAESISVADMERGVGGRIEEAFGAARERGEAAFVTFITAGYPTAKGTSA